MDLLTFFFFTSHFIVISGAWENLLNNWRILPGNLFERHLNSGTKLRIFKKIELERVRTKENPAHSLFGINVSVVLKLTSRWWPLTAGFATRKLHKQRYAHIKSRIFQNRLNYNILSTLFELWRGFHYINLYNIQIIHVYTTIQLL